MARTWKQIETSREARLWIGQVIIPVVQLTAGIAIVAFRNEISDAVGDLYQKAKGRITRLFHKKS